MRGKGEEGDSLVFWKQGVKLKEVRRKSVDIREGFFPDRKFSLCL